MATKKKSSGLESPEFLRYPSFDIAFSGSTKNLSSNYTAEFIYSEQDEPVIPAYPMFSAAPCETFSLARKLYIGLGPKDSLDLTGMGDIFKRVLPKLLRYPGKLQILFPKEIYIDFSISHIANLFITATANSSYNVKFLKSGYNAVNKKNKISEFILVASRRKIDEWLIACQKYIKIAPHILAARQTQVLPSSHFNPEHAEQRARSLAQQYKLKVQVYGKKALEDLGAGGILAVHQGSEGEPRMVVLEYSPPASVLPKKSNSKSVKTLAIIGKGVCFDTGGISLKPSSEMHEMKYDMSGAATALHAIAAISQLKLPLRVVSVVGMVENVPDSKAIKPGDVYKSLKGTTVEVQNTDAEGRLVLGDLLHFAEREFKPDMMINLATLTGAIIISLGHYYSGLFTPGDNTAALIEEAAKDSIEPVWRMPMNRLYKDMLKSDIADLNNIGGRAAGSCTAAAFLSQFVENKNKWAHLDIAGISFMKSGFGVYPGGGTGYGVRLLSEVASKLAKE
jgi:leucyl aminopeptidase